MDKKPISRPQKQPEQEPSTNEWLTTYSDLVTLLFAFFVLLFAMSNINAQKWDLVAATFSNRGIRPEQYNAIIETHQGQGNGDVDPENPLLDISSQSGDFQSSINQTYETFNNYLTERGMEDAVVLSKDEGYMFIRFRDDILFDPDSARIRPQDYELLTEIGNGIKAIENDAQIIRIDGHTAAVPETEDYHISDRTLSSDRANAVLEFFENTIGIDGAKLQVVAYGKHRPIASNATEEGRAANRRIEIYVTNDDDVTQRLNQLYEQLQEE